MVDNAKNTLTTKSVNDRLLLFSQLDPEVLLPEYCQQFIPELVVATLLHKEVLILAADLASNKELAAYLFAHPDEFLLFEDLICNSDAITLVIHPHSEFHGCPFNPFETPVQAWAWMIEHTRLSFDALLPNATQQSFYKRIDAAFSKANRIKESSLVHPLNYPARSNTFARYLRDLLSQKLEALRKLKAFSTLNPDVAKRYVEFASDDEAWRSTLSSKGRLPESLQNTPFYRSAAYRCLKLFPMSMAENKAWRSLFQSVFYSDFCSNLEVMGRFGGRLHDLPLDFKISDEPDAGFVRLDQEVRPTRPLMLGKKLGEAIRKARDILDISKIDLLEPIWTSPTPEKDFSDIWGRVVSIVADIAASEEVGSALHTNTHIWKLPSNTGTVGAAVNTGTESIEFVYNYLKPIYQKGLVARRIRTELEGITAVRAVLIQENSEAA
jgi:hypothetical protein